MRYPLKFLGNLSYVTVGGRLGEELGHASTPSWKRRRRWRLARKDHPEFLVAAVDGARQPVVEGWTDTPDHRFASVVVRSAIRDVPVWTECSDRPSGLAVFGFEPGQEAGAMECRSGRMVGWSTIVEGRHVNVLQPEHLQKIDMALELVPVHTISGP